MRLLGLALAAFALSASAAGAQVPPTAEEVLSHVLDEPTTLERDRWFDANAKGKVVAWVAPVFVVNSAFGSTLVSIRPTERGVVACNVTGKFEAAAKAVKKGDIALCAGRIENYERMMGAALVNVEADSFVIGKDKIDAWQKAQKKTAP